MKRFFLFFILGCNFYMQGMNEEYRKFISFFDAYMGQELFIEKKQVIIPDYQEEKNYTLSFKDINKYLYIIAKKGQEVVENNELSGLQEIVCQMPNKNLSEREKVILQTSIAIDFFQNNDFQTNSQEERSIIVANRNLYHVACLSKATKEMQKALQLKIFPANESFIPLLQKIEKYDQNN